MNIWIKATYLLTPTYLATYTYLPTYLPTYLWEFSSRLTEMQIFLTTNHTGMTTIEPKSIFGFYSS